jgi:hypothetical protein
MRGWLFDGRTRPNDEESNEDGQRSTHASQCTAMLLRLPACDERATIV